MRRDDVPRLLSAALRGAESLAYLLVVSIVFLLRDLLQFGIGDVDGGASKAVYGYAELLVAHLVDPEQLAHNALQRASAHTHIVVLGKCVGQELHREVALSQHIHHAQHLVLGDDYVGVQPFVGDGRGAVLHVRLDEGVVDDGVALFGIDEHKEVGRDADDFHVPEVTFPVVGFHLGGGEGFDAALHEHVAAGFLGVVAHPGNEPFPWFHAYGVANFLSCRNDLF